MKKKDTFALLYIVSGVLTLVGIGIIILDFVQKQAWIKLVDMDTLWILGISLVVISFILGSWAKKQVNKRN